MMPNWGPTANSCKHCGIEHMAEVTCLASAPEDVRAVARTLYDQLGTAEELYDAPLPEQLTFLKTARLAMATHMRFVRKRLL